MTTTTTVTSFQDWVEQLEKAARDVDGDAYAELFSEDSTYLSVDPFDRNEPIRGRSAIRQHVTTVMGRLGELRPGSAEVLCSGPERNLGHCRVTWRNSDNKLVGCDFVFEVILDSNNLAKTYREWNVIRSEE